MIKSKFNNRRFNDFEREDVNPMDGVANMTDVMLVIAVGIMLALVVAWNVDLNKLSEEKLINPEELSVLEEDADGITPDLEGLESIKELGLTEAGTVYRDSDGNLYIIEADE